MYTKNLIDERVEEIAQYFIKTKSTVRATAQAFGFSKSTVHKDLSSRLPKISMTLFKEVNTILQTNKKEAPIRGGVATRQKFLSNSKNESSIWKNQTKK